MLRRATRASASCRDVVRVPILCYHRIEVPPEHASADTNFVTPTAFRAHLRLLASLGCTGVTVSEIARWQRGELQLPPRAVAITFDDAYTSVADAAIPVLAEYGWRSTIYVVSSELGGANRWDTDAPPASLLDAAALRSLASAGHEIGSHTREHTRIRGLSAAVAMHQLTSSRSELEQALSMPVTSFAFPYGSHDSTSLAQVRDAGYASACTLKRWANPRRGNSLRLGRMSVGGPLAAWQFGLKLAKLYATPAR
jgi:peptidoglycan/xylan/chitin deacetylase (PgdA/CDA1 family)